ncbi:hypothetical protein [Vibrio algarum]|uniref:Uncharacterized protein n=1 Tax=Vibrio algarum TaxID=3020714 RepID=A0ABT4YT00_9VIBR|nr:hypothetical protein [Vibrio sp. KJ40-1]MDB1124689.1 hypothetical protein [Vibrio sp. KJ40-1]
MERNHYIHYVKRKVISRFPTQVNSKWYAELQHYDDGFSKPVFHVTRSVRWPVNEIKPNDVIWLVSQLSSPCGNLPPSIDAKITVNCIETYLNAEKECIRFAAGLDSTWFHLVDASYVLKKIMIQLKNGKIVKPLAINTNIEQAFQSVK